MTQNYFLTMCKDGEPGPCYAEMFPSLAQEPFAPFHIERVDNSVVTVPETLNKNVYEVVSVFKVQNDFLEKMFRIRALMVNELRNGAINFTHTFFPCSDGNIASVLKFGLESRTAEGNFGHGIHTSEFFEKADMDNSHGGLGEVRTMLICLAIAGKIKVLPKNLTDTERTLEPAGFDSVQGWVGEYPELVVYSSDRILVRFIVQYRRRCPFVPAPPLHHFEGFYISSLILYFAREAQLKTKENVLAYFELFFYGKITSDMLFFALEKVIKFDRPETAFLDFEQEVLKCQHLVEVEPNVIPPLDCELLDDFKIDI